MANNTKRESARQPLPLALRALTHDRRWVVWKYKEVEGRRTKPPLTVDGHAASTHRPETWCSYAEAVEAMPEGGGIGYVLGPDIEVGAIDIDDCRDPQTGKLSDAAQSIVDRSGEMYVEVTPSEEGIRIIGKTRGGELKRKIIEKPVHLELYRKQWRYITISGRQVQGGKDLTSIDWLIDDLATRTKKSDKDSSASGIFFKLCTSMFERRKSVDDVVAYLKRHSSKYPERYEGRLEREVQRCWDNWDGDVRPAKKKPDLKSKNLEKFVTADTIEPRDPDWEWKPYFCREELFWIAGEGDVGKGLLCADLAARMTTGKGWPMTHKGCQKGNVLWFESEDNPQTTLVPRLIAAGADLKKIAIFNRQPDEFDRLTAKELENRDVGLIILSPMLNYLNIKNLNDHREVMEALEEMSEKIRGVGCTIVGICHLNKKGDEYAMHRLLGSIAFRNFLRHIVVLRKENDDMVRLALAKNNLTRRGQDLLFTKYNTQPMKHADGQYIGITWEKAENNVDLDEKFFTSKSEKDNGAPMLLRNYLADGEWHLSTEVMVDLERKHSLTESAVRQAKYRSPEIEHQSRGFPRKVYWRLKR